MPTLLAVIEYKSNKENLQFFLIFPVEKFLIKDMLNLKTVFMCLEDIKLKEELLVSVIV